MQALAFYERGAALPGRTLHGDRAGLATAALYQRLGRQADARRAYQGLIQRSPNSPEGKAARQALESPRGDYVYVFGFSRGAYTARPSAGCFISFRKMHSTDEVSEARVVPKRIHGRIDFDPNQPARVVWVSVLQPF